LGRIGVSGQISRSILREAPRAFGLRVSGNSLASEWIYEGAIVVVDPDATFVDGKIYAVRVEGGEVAARRLFDMDGRFKLVTGDGNVDEYPKDRVTIIGRVRWSFREH
jgi:SOS-response transcriptional repressor LexA